MNTYPQPPKRSEKFHGQTGAALIFYILAIVVLAVLGSSTVSMFQTSTKIAATPNTYKQAYYMAESGLRYGVKLINDGTVATNATLDTTRYTVEGNNQFDLTINNLSLFCSNTSNKISSGDSFSMSPCNGGLFPAGYTITSDGASQEGLYLVKTQVLDPEYTKDAIEQNIIEVETATISGDRTTVTFVVSGSTKPGLNEPYTMGVKGTDAGSWDVTQGGSINVSRSAVMFPKTNGYITINKIPYTYTNRILNGTTGYTLTNIQAAEGSWVAGTHNQNNLSTGDTVLLSSHNTTNLTLAVVGYAGGGDFTASRELTYSWNSPFVPWEGDDAGLPEMLGGDTQTMGFDNLDDWDHDSKVHIQDYWSAQGYHNYYASVQDINAEVDPEGGHDIAFHQFYFNGKAEADPAKSAVQYAWESTNPYRLTNSTEFTAETQWHGLTYEDMAGKLSYDVQTKMGTGWLLLYGAWGLSVRHHTNSGIEEFYAVSFMKYSHDDSTINDYIPDSIEPFAASTKDLGSSLTFGWRDFSSDGYGWIWYPVAENNEHVMLVLWRQYNNGGTIGREWLAYKDVTPNTTYYDKYLKGKQWWGDGRIVNDNSTLLLRLEEHDGADKLKVFYGEASANYTTRREVNSRSHDIYGSSTNNGQRNRHRPTWEFTDNTSLQHFFIGWPSWALEIKDVPFIQDGNSDWERDGESGDYFYLRAGEVLEKDSQLTGEDINGNPAVYTYKGVTQLTAVTDTTYTLGTDISRVRNNNDGALVGGEWEEAWAYPDPAVPTTEWDDTNANTWADNTDNWSEAYNGVSDHYEGNDWFTLVQDGTTLPGGNYDTSWVMNTSSIEYLAGNIDFYDNYADNDSTNDKDDTFILKDPSYFTPDDGDPWDNRYEIAIHSCFQPYYGGGYGDANEAKVVDDFSIQYLYHTVLDLTGY